MAISLGPSRVTKLGRWLQREGRRGAEMIDETLFDAEEKMEKAVSVGRDDLSTIRTGRANPGMFSRIVIDYYGSAPPFTTLASINVRQSQTPQPGKRQGGRRQGLGAQHPPQGDGGTAPHPQGRRGRRGRGCARR